jgi:hypothetical protein
MRRDFAHRSVDQRYRDVLPTIPLDIRSLAQSKLDFLVHCLGHERAYRIRLFAVTAMVVCYALEHRHRSFILLFAFSCVLGSVYGFLQGAWPFGLVELVWSGIAAESGGQGEGRKPSPEGR